MMIRPRFQAGVWCVRNPRSLAILGIGAIALTLSSCIRSPKANAPSPEVSTAASVPAPVEVTDLADHLSRSGAKLYSTYWCPYCGKQKEMFQSAVSRLEIIECDPNGENAQPDRCNQANVSSYPTWEINGQMYRGLRSLEELAMISNYPGAKKVAR